MADTTSGQVLTSSTYGDNLVGGSGPDTLNAGQGPDTLTGGAGGDVFAYAKLPWNAGHVTDFTLGSDRLDLSALFQASGYTGSNPQADGYISLQAGMGSTIVMYDPDGPASGNPWPIRIATLDGVSANGLTWAQLADPAAPGNPSGPPSNNHFPTVTGLNGGPLPSFTVNEANLPNGTAPSAAGVSVNASIMLNAADGVKDVYVGSQLIINNGAFQPTSYTDSSLPVTIIFNSYDAASGRLDVTYRLNNALNMSAGAGGVQTGWGLSLTDTDGDTTQAHFNVTIYDDTPYVLGDEAHAQIGASPLKGNVLLNDKMGADGGGVVGVSGHGGQVISDGAPNPNGYTMAGAYGSLTVMPNGDYTYTLNSNAPAGTNDVFRYSVRDGDGDQVSTGLVVYIDVPNDGSGHVITAQNPGAHLTGGAGDDTLNASQGADVLTGNGGADVFAFAKLPWSAGQVTDFTVGTDHLDLSALLTGFGYSGSDPVADGWVSFRSDGRDGTLVYFDTNGPASGGDWPYRITDLQHVAPTGLTWANVGLASGSPGGGTGGTGGTGGGDTTPGQVLTSQHYPDTLSGGGGADTLIGGRGPDVLTGNGGADYFVWNDVPWNAGHVTDFTPGTDVLDLRTLFTHGGYAGSDPVADRWLSFVSDGAGGTKVLMDIDGPGGSSPYQYVITTLDHVAPSQIHANDWLFH
jgi:hypothetical protein